MNARETQIKKKQTVSIRIYSSETTVISVPADFYVLFGTCLVFGKHR